MAENLPGIQGVIFHLDSFSWPSTRVMQAAHQRLFERLKLGSLPLGALCSDRTDLSSKGQIEALHTRTATPTFVAIPFSGTSVASGLATAAARGQWSLPATATAVIIGSSHAGEMQNVADQGWRVIHFQNGASEGNETTSCARIESVLDVPAVCASMTKQASPRGKVLVVGHCMKWSRERDFLKRGAFPLQPSKEGICFVPVDLDRPIERQMAPVDILLHKVTDEIIRVEDGVSGTVGSRVVFSEGVTALERYLASHPAVCVVDPLTSVMPLLDRAAIQRVLQSLPNAIPPGICTVRPPRSAQVSKFDVTTISIAMEDGSVVLPAIVKPLIACGASESHTMAVVFRQEGFEELPVPLPATIQEYVDHGAWQHKCYMLGDALFAVPRRSTPDAAPSATADASSQASNGVLPAVRVFDSLGALPTTFSGGEPLKAPPAPPPSATETETSQLDRQAVEVAGQWLKEELGLTLLGFDIVIEKGTGDHVIIDVNYFPSFKDVSDAHAIPALWKALLRAHQEHAA